MGRRFKWNAQIKDCSAELSTYTKTHTQSRRVGHLPTVSILLVTEEVFDYDLSRSPAAEWAVSSSRSVSA